MTEIKALAGFGRTQASLLHLLLRHKNGLTVDQIAQQLGVTRTAVNQHLTTLERDGYVWRRDDIATGGRPSRLYALNERGLHLFPKNYDLFSLKTLEAMIKALGRKEANKTLERIGKELGVNLGAKLKNKSLYEKTTDIVHVLQELGFDAEAENVSQKNAPAITAYNCIYHRLAQADPEICRLDLAFLETASGAQVDHESCMARGDNACRFRLRKS